MESIRQAVTFGHDTWDSSHRLETSWLLTPWQLLYCRALFSLYAFTVLFFNIAWGSINGAPDTVELSFSYFTVITYWGLAFYFLVAAIHTLTYARTGTPLLNRFPRLLQALHRLYYTTITTFPFVVTIVYWALIYSAWYSTKYEQWSNVSEHGLNSFFALFEVCVTRTNPPPWIHLVFSIIIMCGYLGVAYITHATTGVWVYTFLDPVQNGDAHVAGYILGILAAVVIMFIISKYAITLRKFLTEKRGGMMGKFYGGRPIGCGEVELESARMWEK